MPNVDMDKINIMGEYDQPTLAEIWGYKSYDAIRRGIVTVADDNKIILFVTEEKVSYATQYTDCLTDGILHMAGEAKHGNDSRLLNNMNGQGKDEIYLFYRKKHHTPFVYYGKVKLIDAIIKNDHPSEFKFSVDILNKEGLNMNFFGFKISNPGATDLVRDVKNNSQNIIIEQLNQLDSSLKRGSYVFMVLGGDKVLWEKGLIGLAEIIKEPFDKEYDKKNPRNFRLGLKMLLVLPEVMKREEFIGYLDAYDAASIGPNTKGEQNQAIKALDKKQAAAILRAIAEKHTELESKLRELFDESFQKMIFGKMPIMTKHSLAFGETPETISVDDDASDAERVTGGQNILLYGVPGCGKSHTIKEDYIKNELYFERVVFHPDYTYSDFIGQIMPVDKDGVLQYKFVEGPFTRIFRDAVKNPGKMHYMIIEEINRGNAAAILGDVFQLLDREPSGESSYDITNYDIAQFVYKNKTKKIKIPSNLTILATMNTSDQSVFAIDTAFKRRWNFRLVPNELQKCKFKNAKILNTDITWYAFVKTINKHIEIESSTMISNEDKRLGAYFIKKEDLELLSDKEGNTRYNPAFAEKILMYLWNDVFKYNRETIFKEQYKSLEELIKGFETYKFDVFNVEFTENEGHEINEQ